MLANVEHGRIVNNAWSATANETWAADPYGMPLPQQITVKKANNTQHWSSGQYAFDGAGNISAIGGTTYAYDRFGRLVQWKVRARRSRDDTGHGRIRRVRKPTGSYADVCHPAGGGRFSCSGSSVAPQRGVVGTTNHYEGVTHDAAGNVTADVGRTFTYDALNMGFALNANVITGDLRQGAHVGYRTAPDLMRMLAFGRAGAPQKK